MASQAYDALAPALRKGKFAPAYYLVGAEDVLKDQAIREIAEHALDPTLRDFNYDQRSVAQLDAEAVHALCNTLPVMAERRVVVLRDVETWKRKTKGRAALLAYLERPMPETVLVLVQGAGEADADKDLARHSLTVRCDPRTPEQAQEWLVQEARGQGVSFAAGAAEHLIACVGTDLGAIRAELEKLASLADSAELTVEQVGELVGVRQGETPDDWCNAVLGGQPGRAVTLLGPVLAQPGMSGVRLVSLLGTALVGVGIARSHYDRKLRGSSLERAVSNTIFQLRPRGVRDWKGSARAWSGWAPMWPQGRVQAGLRAALDTDRALKGTTISDDRGLLTDLVMQLTVAGREAA